MAGFVVVLDANVLYGIEITDLFATMRDDAARSWIRSPNPDLGYEKPLDLVAAGQYQRVLDLLLALAEGATV